MKNTHPTLLELRRTITATSGLLKILTFEMDNCLRQGHTHSPAGATHEIGEYESLSFSKKVMGTSVGCSSRKEVRHFVAVDSADIFDGYDVMPCL